MSFFGNNNNSASGGFGGFGSSTNNNNNNSNPGGFGATSTGGGLFGGNTATSGGFGSGGGFGSTNTNSPFGANKSTGFGNSTTTSSGGLFGGNTSTSGAFGSGGGFGATNNASSGFGSGNTGGGLFGANKPTTTGFGASNTGGSIFGGGNTSSGFGNTANTGSSLFGSNNNATTGGFGSTNNNATNTGFGSFGASANANANNNNGTAGTPFQAYSEKDTAANQTSYFQSITFQQPYLNKSFEELRTEDYLQGRRFGNSNGQAGSFGTSTGFGGSVFGGNNATNTSNTGGLFGNNTNNTATSTGNNAFGGFGASNTTNTSTAFGSTNTGGGLFGNQNKPATGSVFGNPATSGTTSNAFGSTAGSGGGLFGGGGFGTSNNNNNAPANTGGLFGNNAQPKPSFGAFGNTNTSTGFGNTNTASNTGGGLFGTSTNNTNTNTGGGLFGSNQQQQQQQPQQQQQQQQQPQQNNPFGSTSNNTGGLFGNQNKPAGGGLFGNSTTSNTGGGLFGTNTNTTQQSGGLFGNTNTNTGGGLFGNSQQQNKPASTGLFGNTNTNTNTNSGGGLFGGSTQQQNTGNLFGNNTNTSGSLFGTTQSKPATGGLFGNSTTTPNSGGGLSLFGGNNQQTQQNNSGSLFGSVNQNNQSQQAGNNTSLFGNSMQQQSNNQPNQLHASLTAAPYGNEQLFSSLGAASPPVGPLATPLSGARQVQSKTPSLLASTRLNSPIYTPRNGSVGRSGYGFSYSTYGTPGSAYSVNLTPGASSLLKPTGSLSSALTTRLAKSMSMNSLRGDGTPQDGDSLLRPTPGSTSSRYVATGSMRRLNIDRSLRTDLFAPPENKQVEALRDSDRGLKKQVSFDNSATTTVDAQPTASNALVRTEDDGQDDSSAGLIKAGPKSYPDLSKTPEMEQTNGSSLTTVPEDGESNRQTSTVSSKRLSDGSLLDAEPGKYWTKPALKDLKPMSRAQLSKMGGLTVGRENVGRIEFGPCDLTNVPLDDICGNIVKLTTRIATVYEDDSEKPAMGKGLNVPSTIYLERSWPRSNGGKKLVLSKQGKEYDKHIARLKRVHNTHFKSYDPETGVWCFAVDHFTTYGLDDDDDEDMTEDLPQESSELSEPPATPGQHDGDTMQSFVTSTGNIEDDTFQFKLNQRSESSAAGGVQVPGSIGGISYDYDDPSADEGMEEDFMMSGGLGDAELEEDPFASPGGAVQAPSPSAIQRFQSSMIIGHDADENEIAEQTQEDQEPELPGSFIADEPKLLRSILKPTSTVPSFTSPEKLASTSWEDQLLQTISPKKRDRQALRDIQQTAFTAPEDQLGESLFKRSMLGQSAFGQSYLAQKSAKKVGFGQSSMGAQKTELGKSQAFHTSMDIMNSLWSQEKPTKTATAVTKGFENPYHKKPRLSASSELNQQDAAFHDSLKPSFANNGTLIYAVPGAAPQVADDMLPALQALVGEHEEVRFAKWNTPVDQNTYTLGAQQDVTIIRESDGFPGATTSSTVEFMNVAETVEDHKSREFTIWHLAGILFDPVHIACAHLIAGMTEEEVKQEETRLRTDAFAQFASEYVSEAVDAQIKRSRTAEEKALFYLTMNDVSSACEVLVQGKDFRLATMVAQLPVSEESQTAMKTQIEVWRNRNDWSEFSEPLRAIYSILAGQVCVVAGKNGPAEDRAAEFAIAERFGLHWLQSFGLRVYFGGFDDLDGAIQTYSDDLLSGQEQVQPSPWWNTGEPDGREDTLFGLLRLFHGISNTDLAALFDPMTVSGSAVRSRIAWQLATLFGAKGYSLTTEQMDRLTLGFASELEFAGRFVTSTWVTLHLTRAGQRERAVRSLLERNAAKIPEPSGAASDRPDAEPAARGVFEFLVEDNRIPASLCWSAKALYARAQQDLGLQTLYLLYAGRVDDAHDVLCTTVGPTAVIEEDLDDLLQNVLSQFPTDSRPVGWDAGGGVFESFARMVRLTERQRDSVDGRRLMAALARGLLAMEAGQARYSLEQRVAAIEMGRVLKDKLREAGELIDYDFRDAGRTGMDVDGQVKTMGAFERYQNAMGVVV